MPLLGVRLIAQWGATANARRADCGPACVAMCLDYYGLLGATTVDQLGAETALASGATGLMPPALVRLAGRHGLTTGVRTFVTEADLKAEIDAKRPVIILLAYRFILGRLDQRDNVPGLDGHFVVLVGYDDTHYVLNDPDYWYPYTGLGHDYRVPVTELQPAMAEYDGGCVFMEAEVSLKDEIVALANQIKDKAALIEDSPVGETITVYVTSLNGINVRATPVVNASNKVGSLAYRTPTVVEKQSVASLDTADLQPWYKIAAGQFKGRYVAGSVVSTILPKV